MAATPTEIVFDTPAPDFRLPATDGREYGLDDVAGEKGTVIVFICNHCPYVIAVIDRLVADARVLLQEGVGFAAICANDAKAYPADSFGAMKVFAKAHGFPFPYLHDESQAVAKAYGAVCTPDFFGYGADRKLKYRGRLDEGRTSPPAPGANLWRRCGRSRRPARRSPSRRRPSAVRSSGRRGRDLVNGRPAPLAGLRRDNNSIILDIWMN